MAQDAQLISQASKVESLASDGLVSVSTGAGQPQKNMELAKFADSLGSSVPLQQTSEQVSITGLYARTSDGKMVELTKESVASVMEGLITKHRSVEVKAISDLNTFIGDGSFSTTYFCAPSTAPSNMPQGLESEDRFFLTINRVGNEILQKVTNRDGNYFYERTRMPDGVWNAWQRIDNFGYNTLAELSSGVAEQIGYRRVAGSLNANDVLTIPTWLGLLVVSSSSSGHSGVYIVSTSKVTKLIESSETFSGHFELTIGDTGIKIKNISGAYRSVEAISIGYRGSKV